MIEGTSHLTTQQAATILGVTEKTIYNYVKDKKLKPKNIDNWQIEGFYYFASEDIERLLEAQKRPGKTTSEVAEMLGVSSTTIFRYIKDGKLPATQGTLNGRTVYFIKEEDAENFNTSHIQANKRKKKDFYSKKIGYALFQLFVQEDTGSSARIISINGAEGVALTNNDQEITLEELKKLKYSPAYSLNHKPNTKKGFVKFIFKKPHHQVKSAVYRILDLFYAHTGPLNMRIQINDDEMVVEVKPTFLPINKNDYITEIEIMNHHLKEGKVLTRLKGIMIDTKFEGLHINFPEMLKAQIKQRASLEGKSMEEVVIECLSKEFSN